MDLINKLPRSVLVAVAVVGVGACTILISTARADLDKFKSIAYIAKNTSDSNTVAISELKEGVKDIRVAQEIQRREYREDRQKDAEIRTAELRQMEDRIIRAVVKS